MWTRADASGFREAAKAIGAQDVNGCMLSRLVVRRNEGAADCCMYALVQNQLQWIQYWKEAGMAAEALCFVAGL
jgi:hypothetical protein